MIDQLARDRELLTLPFPESAVRLRPDVYCRSCKAPTEVCARHQVTVCATCGEHVSTAHTHVPYIPHEYIRDRLDQVDANWSCDPSAFDEHGNPVLDQGCLWVRLTVAGKTVYGVGDGAGETGARHRQLAFTYAFRHAAELLGVGRYLRLQERERPPVESPVEAPAATAPEPEPSPAVPALPSREHLLGRIILRSQRKQMTPAQLDADFKSWSTSDDQPGGIRLHDASDKQLAQYLELLGGTPS